MDVVRVLEYIHACDDYKAYPIDNLRKQATMVQICKRRAYLEYKLRYTLSLTMSEVISIQDQLNELPLYLSVESTLKLYKCLDFINNQPKSFSIKNKRKSI